MTGLVRILASGGTIASTPGPSGYRPSVAGAAILDAALRGVPSPPPTEVEDVAGKTSYMLDEGDLRAIRSRAEAALADPDVAALVLVMGTAAMEELAFLLDLKLPRTKPVVLTGAMLNARELGADGPRNLADAIRYAVSPGVQAGVAVVMGGRAHAARYVLKLRRASTAAFESDPGGPVATVDGERVTHLAAIPALPRLPAPGLVGPVDVVTATLAGDGRLFRAAVASGARGVVVEGLPGGGGMPEPMMAAACEALAAGIPVVVASRAPLGRSTSAAGGGSGPADVLAAGGLLAHDLSAAKARILLMCCLAEGQGLPEIRSTFAQVAP